jgi:hypothetical protein
MKNRLSLIYLFCLVGGIFVACQSFPDEGPHNPVAGSEEGEAIFSKARKVKHGRFGAFLTGTEEVPPIPSGEAEGTGAAFFEMADDGNSLNYEVRVANLTGVTAGHIHLAPVGVNGGVVVNLNPNVSSSTQNGIIAEGNITRENLVGALLGHPLDTLFSRLEKGLAYVNIHTTRFPGGEIRGQVSMIRPNENGNYDTRLSGAEEVPANNSKARGVANFKFNSDNSALSYHLNVANLENVRASHIHLGKFGQNGPIVVGIRTDLVQGRVNGVYAKGVFTDANLSGLMQGGDLIILREALRTGNAYVNVHTHDFPGGEIRGQLSN